MHLFLRLRRAAGRKLSAADADDAAQETIARVCARLETGPLEDLVAYAFKILHELSWQLRAEPGSLRRPLLLGDAAERVGSDDGPEPAARKRWFGNDFLPALEAELTERQARVLRVYLRSSGVRQASRELDMDPRTVVAILAAIKKRRRRSPKDGNAETGRG